MTVDSVLYESHIAFEFARNWGRLENSRHVTANQYAELLGNAQNPLDEIFGDFVGRQGVRYFIIEFKRFRQGFAEEVSKRAGKSHRSALYSHLRDDQDCLELSRRGHFAAYQSASKNIALESYAFAPAQLDKSKIFSHDVPSVHEMDYIPDSFSVGQFYDEVCHRPNSIDTRTKLFEFGIGLSEEGFYSYIDCMYQHVELLKQTIDGFAMAVALDPATGQTEMISDRVQLLLLRLIQCLDEFKQKYSESSSYTPGNGMS